MGSDELTDKIKKLKEKVHDEFAANLDVDEGKMAHLLDYRESVELAAGLILENVIKPAIEAVRAEIENTEVRTRSLHGLECWFLHTREMPASGKIAFTINVDQHFKNPRIYFYAELFPAFIQVKSDEYLDMTDLLGKEPGVEATKQPVLDKIREWVELRISNYLLDYLKVEYHPAYQKDNYVVDPVCRRSMVPGLARVVTREGKSKLYFCSNACFNEYIEEKAEQEKAEQDN